MTDDKPMTPLETAEALSCAKLRVAELEAAITKALKHAEGNGMKDWPLFRAMRKVMKSR